MTSMEQSPTIRRRQLGVELRRLREEAGMTGPQLAARMEWDPGKVYRLEGGRQGIKPRELRELLRELGVTADGEVSHYAAMARDGKKPGWWSVYGQVSKTYDTYIGIETSANEIRCWEPLLVNGLLQTEAYARAVIRGTAPDLPTAEVERQIQLRLARQERLADVRLWMVIDESILHRIVGGAEVMKEQLSLLVNPPYRQVSLQVMPFAEGAHPGTRGGFTILTLADGTATYVETPAGEIYPEGQYADACNVAFGQLLARALSPDRSRHLIERALSDY
ncbi:helix-turn-helix protein [Stackebrandtia albiflava]|uniref:Helix-turn-helix protein n=1 Tax=Stackebrandtia albiflava TaxID=406432 RepID=A0A562UYG8_9ACTN|nr:helix-turn-helix transcriptional regulator [Stackebrandtia albiflava]TWJ10684.1 helix-turn-helix protein [Stackebrandtia albiflava]